MLTIDYNLMPVSSGAKILDIGCGHGRHVCGASPFKGITTIGADKSLADVRQAKTHIRLHEEYGKPFAGRWSLVCADIMELPFPDGAFDGIICSEVLEHIENDKKAAKELYRILAEKGVLAVSVPRYFPERICWALSESYHSNKGGHVRIYKKEEIIALFSSMGLELIHTHYAHGLHSPYWWLKCLLGQEEQEKGIVALYNRFLTWDIMRKPRITAFLEQLINPLIGKSFVAYFRKNRLNKCGKRDKPSLARSGN